MSMKDKQVSAASAAKGTPEKTSGKVAGNVNSLFSLDELSKLVKILEQHEVSEFELERGDEKIRLRRGPQQVMMAATPMHSGVTTYATAASQEAPAAATSPRVDITPVSDQPMKNGKSAAAIYHEVKSPMVGTFYKRPAPDAKAYVEIGGTVKKGDVLCIVEAMKLMNEIEADVAGRVVEVCLNDAQMCEYGEVLFRIDPTA